MDVRFEHLLDVLGSAYPAPPGAPPAA